MGNGFGESHYTSELRPRPLKQRLTNGGSDQLADSELSRDGRPESAAG